MKVELVSGINLPCGFRIEAENEAEDIVLRHFINYENVEKGQLHILSSGHTMGRFNRSFIVAYKEKPTITEEIIKEEKTNAD